MKRNALIATVLGALALSMGFSTVYAAEYTQSVCLSSIKDYTISPISVNVDEYSWGVDNALTSDYSLSLSETSNSKATVEWKSVTLATQTFDLWSQEKSTDGCVGPKSIVHVTVNPLPEVESMSNSICSATQKEGTNVDVVDLSLPVADKNGIALDKWEITKIDLPTGVTQKAGQDYSVLPITANDKEFIKLDAYNNENNTAQDVVYHVTPYAQDSDCAGAEFTISITVYPEVKAPTISF